MIQVQMYIHNISYPGHPESSRPGVRRAGAQAAAALQVGGCSRNSNKNNDNNDNNVYIYIYIYTHTRIHVYIYIYIYMAALPAASSRIRSPD